jgi:hypothetical protein
MLGNFEIKRVRDGAARSRREAVAHATRSTCKDCGGSEILLSEERSTNPDVVLVLRTSCDECETRWEHEYTAGPGWDDQPETDDAPIFANTDAPSTLLPAAYFRERFDAAVARLEHRDAPNEDRDFVDAKSALESLFELEKLARSAGETLEPEVTGRREWLIERFHAAGGELG